MYKNTWKYKNKCGKFQKEMHMVFLLRCFYKTFNCFMTEAVIRLLYTNSLQSKSVDWFLYDNGPRHESVNQICIQNSVKHVTHMTSTLRGDGG